MKITKILLSALALSLSIAFNSFSQNSQNYIIMVKPAGGNTWGYANIKGEMVIPASYYICYPFSEGLAIVFNEKTKKFIILTPTGEQLKTKLANFEVRNGFGFGGDVGYSNGMLPVSVNEKWGYLDNNGNLAIMPIYENASKFNDGYAIVTKNGKEIILDKKGNEIVSKDPRVIAINRFKEGLAPFNDRRGKIGFIDTTGKVVIEPQFNSAGFFNDGLAWAKTLSGKFGFINKTGQWVIEPTYIGAKDFDTKSGLAAVKTLLSGPYHINKEGKILDINPTLSYENFSEGLCEGTIGSLWGFYDTSGKWIIEPELQGVRPFKNGYAAAKTNGSWGIINTEGKWVIEPIFKTIKDVEVY